jgi:hypothetical protein
VADKTKSVAGDRAIASHVELKGAKIMLDVSQDKFITDFVTTFLATWSADRYKMRGEGARKEDAPVEQAVWSARRAWMSLLERDMIRF